MSENTNLNLKKKSLWEIARVIRQDWKKINFAAEPYLDAMSGLDKITDTYGFDTAKSIVLYFLSNAGAWRGEVARAVKVELKSRCK